MKTQNPEWLQGFNIKNDDLNVFDLICIKAQYEEKKKVKKLKKVRHESK